MGRNPTGKTVFCSLSVKSVTLFPVGVCTVKHLANGCPNELILISDLSFAIIPLVGFKSHYYFWNIIQICIIIHLPKQSGLSGKRSSNANA